MDSGLMSQKDSNFVLLSEPKSFVVKNDTNQLCNELESITPRKKRRKGKRKSLSNSEGVELSHVDSGQHELSPALVVLSPEDPKPLLLPKPAPVGEKNEATQLCTKPYSTSPKFEGSDIKDMDSGLVPPTDLNFVLLPEPESFAGKNDTDQLCTKLESVTPSKKRRKRNEKGKSLSYSERVEVSHVNSERLELCPNLVVLSPKDPVPLLLPKTDLVGENNEATQLYTLLDSTSPEFKGVGIKDVDNGLVPPKDSNFVLLPEPKSFAGKNDTDQLCTELESVTPRKKRRKGKKKSLSNSEGVELSRMASGQHELCNNLAALSPKDPDPLLLPKPAPIGEKNEANKLCIELECNSEPQSVTPRKKRRKRKGKSLSDNEGVVVRHVNSEDHELCPNFVVLFPKDPEPLLLPESSLVCEATHLCTELDSTSPKFKGAEIKDVDSGLVPPKDLNFVLLPEPESFAGKNDTDQLCTELESVNPRKKRRKGKKKSLSNSKGAELSHVDSGQRELCHNLVVLSPKEPDPLLLPKLTLVGEKSEANKLCTKFEQAERKDMDLENLELCPKLDPLPTKDFDPQLLPESESAPLKGVDQEIKRQNKKFEGDGAESSRPNGEHSQQCHEAKPETQEEQNHRKRKRQAMNETCDSSVQPMVSPNYDFGPRGILISGAVRSGPWLPKGPLKDYERYERCLGCRQICERDQTCRRLRGRHHDQKTQICFFCGSTGHLIGKCPNCPGAKCADGKIMLNDYVRKECRGTNSKRSSTNPKRSRTNPKRRRTNSKRSRINSKRTR